MRVGELGNKLKVVGEEWRGVLERGENEDSFVVDDGILSRFDGVQVDVLDRGRFDLEGTMMIEDDGCLQMTVP